MKLIFNTFSNLSDSIDISLPPSSSVSNRTLFLFCLFSYFSLWLEIRNTTFLNSSFISRYNFTDTSGKSLNFPNLVIPLVFKQFSFYNCFNPARSNFQKRGDESDGVANVLKSGGKTKRNASLR